MQLTDDEVAVLVAVDAYTVDATTAPARVSAGQQTPAGQGKGLSHDRHDQH
jgi:hypothetical protein